jgi:hypothetical protein
VSIVTLIAEPWPVRELGVPGLGEFSPLAFLALMKNANVPTRLVEAFIRQE